MKRVLFGFVWFIAIYFGSLMIGGGIAGGIAGKEIQASEDYQQSRAIGEQAGIEFGRKFGSMIFIGSLIISIAGTYFGVLPGTKPKNKDTAAKPSDDEKTCPKCAEKVKAAATVCRFCGHEFT